MRAQPIKLVFGDKEFTLRPLTIGQVEQIEPLVSSSDAKSPTATFVEALRIALQRDYPDTDVRDLEMGAYELGETYTKILKSGGFIQADASGEADSPETTG
jgi:hypothetical protein